MEAINATKPHVDVLSFQGFRDPVNHLNEWHRKTGKPVLLADAARVNFRSEAFFKPNNGDWYAKTLATLHKNPGCIGFDLGSAYQQNKARRRGLLDELETPDKAQIQFMKVTNEKISRWIENEF